MNKAKRTGTLVLALLLSIAMMLSACGGQTSTGETTANSGEITYSVAVVDALGNPWTDGVIVRFLQGGQQAAMQVADAGGVAEKALPAGEYNLELMFTDENGQYYYDQSDADALTLTAEKTSLQVELSFIPTAEPETLVVENKEYQAYPVGVGGTYVDLIPGERTYFLFTPTEPGTYEFSMVGDAEKIGYYGGTFFVQSESVAEVVDNVFTLSVRAGMIGTEGSTAVMVLGIDAGSAENCTLTITRTGDPEHTVEDEPWHVYQPTAELAPYTLSASASLKEFDLTASSGTYNLVLNEKDGFYHLDSADGPLVLVSLGVDGTYLDCFQTILDRSGVTKYFYDDAGEFIKKESYTECLLQYIENMDEKSGVYPLTEDLKYIIQQRGDHVGWFDKTSSSYLFVDKNGMPLDGINPEISWLFMCSYTESY